MKVAKAALLSLLFASPVMAQDDDDRVFVTLGMTDRRECHLFVSISNFTRQTIDGATVSFTVHMPLPNGTRRTLQAINLTAPVLDDRDFWVQYVPIEECVRDLTAVLRSGVRCASPTANCEAKTVLRIGNSSGGRVQWDDAFSPTRPAR